MHVQGVVGFDVCMEPGSKAACISEFTHGVDAGRKTIEEPDGNTGIMHLPGGVDVQNGWSGVICRHNFRSHVVKPVKRCDHLDHCLTGASANGRDGWNHVEYAHLQLSLKSRQTMVQGNQRPTPVPRLQPEPFGCDVCRILCRANAPTSRQLNCLQTTHRMGN